MFYFKQHIKPSFIVIGGIKCGTSSLYRYLNEHPTILPCKVKEPGVFSTRNFLKTLYKLPAYSRMYPKKKFIGTVKANWIDLTQDEKYIDSIFFKTKKAGNRYITGEASADTLTRAYPNLVKVLFPKIRLIILLRNPTQRFLSHYKMNMRFAKAGRSGHQLLSLDNFIDVQLNAYSKGNKSNVLGQGVYHYHIAKWLNVFNSSQLFLAKSSNLFNENNAQLLLNNIFEFLNIDAYKFLNGFVKFNQSKVSNAAFEKQMHILDAFYKPHNQILAHKFESTPKTMILENTQTIN